MSDWLTAPIAAPRFTAGDWLRILWRGAVLGGLTYGCLVVMLLVRLVEAPLFRQARPWTPHITQFVCRAAFVILRLPLVVRGTPMSGVGATVANHASWLDIFALNAAQRGYFVAKAEVAGWAGIGWLARGRAPSSSPARGPRPSCTSRCSRTASAQAIG